jgi:hypothetical protein
MMIETHTIRLRGPWQCDLGGRQTRIRMPTQRRSVVGDDHRGRLSCRRKFGCPTCLDAHERVWLVIEMPARAGDATLNGALLGRFDNSATLTEFDITARLRERNELSLDFDFIPPESAAATPESDTCTLLFKEVRLEIRG